MDLVGQLSNPSSTLRFVLDAFPDGLRGQGYGPVVPQPTMRKLGNGIVRDAVLKVLATAEQPMKLPDICRAVGHLVGEPVSKHSVTSCLSKGASGKEPAFERVARGHYRLRPQT
jgi:hypothetical protein